MLKLKRALVFIAALLTLASASAEFRWGPTAGLNVTHFSWKQNLVPVKDACGFNAGLIGEVMIPGIGFGIDFGLRYSMVGANIDFGSKEIWSSSGWGNEKVRFHTLQLPVNLRFKWTRLNGVEDIVAPFAYAGPLFQFQCSSSQKELFDTPVGSVGIQVGLGAELIRHIQISAGYNFGVTYITRTAKLDNFSARSSNWQVNVAYLF